MTDTQTTLEGRQKQEQHGGLRGCNHGHWQRTEGQTGEERQEGGGSDDVLKRQMTLEKGKKGGRGETG